MKHPMTHLLYESSELSDKAKLIFGEDLVKTAYYMYSVITNPKNDLRIFKNALEDASEIQKVAGTNESISLDAREILIEFVNGRFVSAYTSEWGSIDLFGNSIESTDTDTFVIHKKESE